MMKRQRRILSFRILFLSVLLFAAQFVFAQDKKATRSSAYPFKAGEGIQINVYPDTISFLNSTFPIDGAGDVTFPIIGKVNVLRMTRSDLEKKLKKTFGRFLLSTEMYINPVIRVTLLGGFQRPGLYYVDQNATLWDVVRLAGGPLREDGVTEMVWERSGDEQSDNLAPFFESGISLRKMGFHSGDQIWTPSPDARTFWDAVADVMPLLTFATTAVMTYFTIRQQQLLFQLQYNQ